MKTVLRIAFVLMFAFAGFAVGPAACGNTTNSNGDLDGGDGGTSYVMGTLGDGGLILGGGDGAATNVTINRSNCSGGKSTTISGTVYDPAMVNPIFNVAVYVPGTLPLPALPSGVSCASCADLYTTPQASAVTDATGRFSIANAPDGMNVPLVVQVGKWRKLYTINTVTPCQDNPQPDKSLRLPKSHTDGDLPNIAVSTGSADSLECLLLRMGVDPGEYMGGSAGPGRIHIFTGNGATTNGGTSPDPGMTLWDSDTDINNYDIVLLSCEGQETLHMNQQVLLDYGNGGGRVFASHFHYAWFDTGPFATTISPALATWTTDTQLDGNLSTTIVQTLPNGKAFPEGVALNTWLGTVGALGPTASAGTPAGELPIIYACHNADVSATNAYSQPWVAEDKSSPHPGSTEYFSFDLPVGTSAEGQCGRVVYSDLHVSLGPGNGPDPDYPGFNSGGICPDGCATHPLTPQEKALEFMIFDLSSCLIPPGSEPPTMIVQ
jgi:hypothetical protein